MKIKVYWDVTTCRLVKKITGVLEKPTAISSGSNSPTHSSGTLVTTHDGMVSKKA